MLVYKKIEINEGTFTVYMGSEFTLQGIKCHWLQDLALNTIAAHHQTVNILLRVATI